MRPLPNRIAVYVTALGALAAGLLPLVGNLDWESTAGILGALVAITGVVATWLYNWGKYERGDGAGIMPGELDDEFDEQIAEPVPAAAVEAANTPEGTTYAEPSSRQPPGFAP
jgi:hypothetical protein